jgi:hypothetical protein
MFKTARFSRATFTIAVFLTIFRSVKHPYRHSRVNGNPQKALEKLDSCWRRNDGYLWEML